MKSWPSTWTKAPSTFPSTRIRILLNRILFLHEPAFCPHGTSESAHRNRLFFEPLFSVDFFGSEDSRGRLKVNYVITSGPVFQVQNGGQQCFVSKFAGSYLILHAFKSILLFRQLTSHLGIIQIVQSFSSRRRLVRRLRFEPRRQRRFWVRPAQTDLKSSGQRTGRHGYHQIRGHAHPGKFWKIGLWRHF